MFNCCTGASADEGTECMGDEIGSAKPKAEPNSKGAPITKHASGRDAQFSVEVELQNGKTVSCKPCMGNDKVHVLKDYIRKSNGIPKAQLDKAVLTFWGQRMDDDTHLEYYGIPWNGTDVKLVDE